MSGHTVQTVQFKTQIAKTRQKNIFLREHSIQLSRMCVTSEDEKEEWVDMQQTGT